MNNVERDNNQTAPESHTQQEHRSNHDNLGWARKYLDLADQAIANNPGEASEQR